MKAPAVRLGKDLFVTAARYIGGAVAIMICGFVIGVGLAWLTAWSVSLLIMLFAFVFAGRTDYPYPGIEPDPLILIPTSIMGMAVVLVVLISVATLKGFLDKLPPPIGYRPHLEPWVEK